MQVKKFEAKSLKEALDVIKKELGPEAIILSTKRNKQSFGLLNGPSVEVTAAVTDHALLKKKMTDDPKKAFKEIAAKEMIQKKQDTIYNRFARKVNHTNEPKVSLKEIPKRPAGYVTKELNTSRLSKRFVDIQDTDIENELFQKKMREASELVTTQSLKPQVNPQPSPVAKPVLNLEEERQQQHPSHAASARKESPQRNFGEIGLLREQLIWCGVDEAVSDQIVRVVHSDNEHWKAIKKQTSGDQLEALIPMVLNYIRIGRPIADGVLPHIADIEDFGSERKTNAQSRKRVHVFIGGTGVGKTTTIAKIAARLAQRQKLRVGLLTCDIFRIGGVEHLQSYAEIMNLPLKTISDPEEVPAALGTMFQECDVVLFDTPGTSTIDVERLSFIKQCLDRMPDPHVYLVSSVSQPAALRNYSDLASRFGGISYDGHVFTKVDESDVRGEMLNLAFTSKRPVHYIGHGQNVPDDLEEATRNLIGKLIFQLHIQTGLGDAA